MYFFYKFFYLVFVANSLIVDIFTTYIIFVPYYIYFLFCKFINFYFITPITVLFYTGFVFTVVCFVLVTWIWNIFFYKIVSDLHTYFSKYQIPSFYKNSPDLPITNVDFLNIKPKKIFNFNPTRKGMIQRTELLHEQFYATKNLRFNKKTGLFTQRYQPWFNSKNFLEKHFRQFRVYGKKDKNTVFNYHVDTNDFKNQTYSTQWYHRLIRCETLIKYQAWWPHGRIPARSKITATDDYTMDTAVYEILYGTDERLNYWRQYDLFKNHQRWLRGTKRMKWHRELSIKLQNDGKPDPIPDNIFLNNYSNHIISFYHSHNVIDYFFVLVATTLQYFIKELTVIKTTIINLELNNNSPLPITNLFVNTTAIYINAIIYIISFIIGIYYIGQHYFPTYYQRLKYYWKNKFFFTKNLGVLFIYVIITYIPRIFTSQTFRNYLNKIELQRFKKFVPTFPDFFIFRWFETRYSHPYDTENKTYSTTLPFSLITPNPLTTTYPGFETWDTIDYMLDPAELNVYYANNINNVHIPPQTFIYRARPKIRRITHGLNWLFVNKYSFPYTFFEENFTKVQSYTDKFLYFIFYIVLFIPFFCFELIRFLCIQSFFLLLTSVIYKISFYKYQPKKLYVQTKQTIKISIQNILKINTYVSKQIYMIIQQSVFLFIYDFLIAFFIVLFAPIRGKVKAFFSKSTIFNHLHLISRQFKQQCKSCRTYISRFIRYFMQNIQIIFYTTKFFHLSYWPRFKFIFPNFCLAVLLISPIFLTYYFNTTYIHSYVEIRFLFISLFRFLRFEVFKDQDFELKNGVNFIQYMGTNYGFSTSIIMLIIIIMVVSLQVLSWLGLDLRTFDKSVSIPVNAPRIDRSLALLSRIIPFINWKIFRTPLSKYDHFVQWLRKTIIAIWTSITAFIAFFPFNFENFIATLLNEQKLAWKPFIKWLNSNAILSKLCLGKILGFYINKFIPVIISFIVIILTRFPFWVFKKLKINSMFNLIIKPLITQFFRLIIWIFSYFKLLRLLSAHFIGLIVNFGLETSSTRKKWKEQAWFMQYVNSGLFLGQTAYDTTENVEILLDMEFIQFMLSPFDKTDTNFPTNFLSQFASLQTGSAIDDTGDEEDTDEEQIAQASVLASFSTPYRFSPDMDTAVSRLLTRLEIYSENSSDLMFFFEPLYEYRIWGRTNFPDIFPIKYLNLLFPWEPQRDELSADAFNFYLTDPTAPDEEAQYRKVQIAPGFAGETDSRMEFIVTQYSNYNLFDKRLRFNNFRPQNLSFESIPPYIVSQASFYHAFSLFTFENIVKNIKVFRPESIIFTENNKNWYADLSLPKILSRNPLNFFPNLISNLFLSHQTISDFASNSEVKFFMDFTLSESMLLRKDALNSNFKPWFLHEYTIFKLNENVSSPIKVPNEVKSFYTFTKYSQKVSNFRFASLFELFLFNQSRYAFKYSNNYISYQPVMDFSYLFPNGLAHGVITFYFSLQHNSNNNPYFADDFPFINEWYPLGAFSKKDWHYDPRFRPPEWLLLEPHQGQQDYEHALVDKLQGDEETALPRHYSRYFPWLEPNYELDDEERIKEEITKELSIIRKTKQAYLKRILETAKNRDEKGLERVNLEMKGLKPRTTSPMPENFDPFDSWRYRNDQLFMDLDFNVQTYRHRNILKLERKSGVTSADPYFLPDETIFDSKLLKEYERKSLRPNTRKLAYEDYKDNVKQMVWWSKNFSRHPYPDGELPCLFIFRPALYYLLLPSISIIQVFNDCRQYYNDIESGRKNY